MAEKFKNASTSEDEDSRSEAEAETTIHSGVLPCPEKFAVQEFEKLEEEERMMIMLKMVNALCDKVTEIDIVLNHDTDGLITKTGTMQTQCDENTNLQSSVNQMKKDLQSLVKLPDKVDKNCEEIEHLKEENSIIKGLLVKNSKQLQSLNEKVAMQTARSKEKNITITNLLGDIKGEVCKDSVVSFLRSQVEIDADHEEILVAHRIGKLDKSKRSTEEQGRVMLMRLQPELKKRIFENIKNLKDKKNDQNKPFYINKQLPEMFIEQNRENREIIATIKKKEKSLPVEQRSNIEIIDHHVCTGGSRVPKSLQRVEINELFPDKAERDKQARIILSASDVTGVQGSTFLGYAAITRNIHEIRRAYHKVNRLHPGADHVVASYINNQHTGYQDDQEYGAGHKLLKYLQETFPDQKNLSVFLVRSFGGVKLGPDRFQHMKNSVSVAVQRLISK